MSLRVLSPTFRHGVHPDDHKDTASRPVERMPFTGRYVMPLGQHIGAPSVAEVRVGERVTRGQRIAGPGGFVSVALHSPVTGRVVAIGSRRHPTGHLVPSIEIEADPFATQELPARPPIDVDALDRDTFLGLVQAAGLVGMGGAAFPAHVKFAIPDDKRVERLVVNGCECEPYLTCDHRTMVEEAEAVIRGIDLLLRKLSLQGATIGVEENKPDAIRALRAVVGDRTDIEVRGLPVKYPQGAEKMLIKALFGIEVPAGSFPLDVHLLVSNVGTMAALAHAVDRGQPLIERVVTVSGPGIRRPGNVLVPLGTPVREVIEAAGGLLPDTRTVVMGGPMMGQPLGSLDVPVLKGTSGILAFTEAETEHPPEYACVRCGRCLDACPNFLNPSRLARLAKAERYDEMEAGFALDCMECGSCSYTCPSGIPIVHLIRVAKSEIRAGKKKPS